MPTGIFQYSKFQGLKLRAIVPHTGEASQACLSVKNRRENFRRSFLLPLYFLRFRVLKYKSIIYCEGGFVLNNKLKDDNVDFLFQAILALETMEECYDFF